MRRRSLSVAAAVCLTLLAAAMMAIPASAVQVRETVQVDSMYNSWGATRFYDGLAGVTDRGAGVPKYGFIDTNGELVIPFEYFGGAGAGRFSDGLTKVGKNLVTNASPGYLDRNGDLVLALRPQWGSGDFHEGFAWVKTRKNGYLEDIYGYMDKTGTLVVPFQYQYASDFSEGLARVQDSTSGLYGFVDQTGAEVIPCQYHKASSFSDGMAAIGDEQGLYGFIDREGNTVIACQFTQVDSFSQGLAGAKGENGSWGFIDKTGRWVIPARYSRILGFSEGLAPVAVLQDNQVRRWGFVDQTGAEVIPCQYTTVLGFSEGLAAAYTPVNGLWGFIDKGGYIDKAGNVVVPFQYEWAGSFSDGYALAKKELPEDDLVILHIEEGPAPRAVAVNKTDNGDVSVSASQASGGETVTVMTVTPDSGYALEAVTVLDKDGKALALTDKGGGRYTFTMPDCDVTVGRPSGRTASPAAPSVTWPPATTTARPWSGRWRRASPVAWATACSHPTSPAPALRLSPSCGAPPVLPSRRPRAASQMWRRAATMPRRWHGPLRTALPPAPATVNSLRMLPAPAHRL